MRILLALLLMCSVCWAEPIHKELKLTKNDYVNEVDRGTVEYTTKCRNYCYHKVIIPDGTIISETNFTQNKPHTVAITGKNLTFINCNLTNNELDPSWTIKDCVTAHIKRVITSDKLDVDKRKISVSMQYEIDGKYKEVSNDETTVSIGDYPSLLLTTEK
jgi:hypothetical protein